MSTERERREREQLIGAADLYLDLASTVMQTEKIAGSMTVSELESGHTGLSLSHAEHVFSHLASAAVRIATLCESKREKATYHKVSASEIKSHLDEHVHWLLRDNIGHIESGGDDNQRKADARQKALTDVTINQCLTALRKRLSVL